MSEYAIDISGISKRFDAVQALESVSLQIEQGALFGLLGPNGAGKTTLFSIIANFLQADAGSIRVLGHDINRISQLQGRLSMLPQDALFQKNTSIVDQLVFFRRLDGKTRKEALVEVEETLERVGLAEYTNRGVHALSHGMVKRLGIAQAFLGNPEVILLDEPTSGLDPANSRQIRDLVRELHSRSVTVVISSHNLAEIQELCAHVAILDEGKVVTAGSVEEITRSGKKVELLLSRPLTPPEQEKIKSLVYVAGLTELRENRYVLNLDQAAAGAAGETMTNDLLRVLLEIGPTLKEYREGNTLEEHFLKVTGKGED